IRISPPNHVVARPCFWYFVFQLKKMKSSGEIVCYGQVFETSPLRWENLGIWLHYDSCSNTHHIYRQCRGLTRASAITQCYRDMGTRLWARDHSQQLLPTSNQAVPRLQDQVPSTRVLHRQHKPRFTTKRSNIFI
uniref:Large ribosomal subunit protein eL20 n=1 Tax=Sus scrofa TaxID=9823 RepID=A0A8W4FL27_PIG